MSGRCCADCGAGESANLSLWTLSENERSRVCGHTILLCGECWHKRENYDGPDDGEAWSGGFAENH